MTPTMAPCLSPLEKVAVLSLELTCHHRTDATCEAGSVQSSAVTAWNQDRPSPTLN